MNPAIGAPLFRIKTIGEVVHSIKGMEKIIFFFSLASIQI
jgi:hypothetical protein